MASQKWWKLEIQKTMLKTHIQTPPPNWQGPSWFLGLFLFKNGLTPKMHVENVGVLDTFRSSKNQALQPTSNRAFVSNWRRPLSTKRKLTTPTSSHREPRGNHQVHLADSSLPWANLHQICSVAIPLVKHYGVDFFLWHLVGRIFRLNSSLVVLLERFYWFHTCNLSKVENSRICFTSNKKREGFSQNLFGASHDLHFLFWSSAAQTDRMRHWKVVWKGLAALQLRSFWIKQIAGSPQKSTLYKMI